QNRLAIWQTPTMQQGIKAMWQAYRSWKQAKQQTPEDVLRISRYFHQYKDAHKDFKKAGKAAKKAWFHSRLADLQHAANIGDSRALYAGLRTVAPKKSSVKVQLRDPQGQLQDPSTQLAQLTTHYKTLYAADADPTTAGPQRQAISIDVSEDHGRPRISETLHMGTAMGSDSGAMVQRKCSFATPTVVDRHAQLPQQLAHFAGIQLSLDLSSAFDLLDWRLLDRALTSSGVPLELKNQILSWYSEITYVITHLGLTAKVQAQQRLRQGCKLAPLLWILSLAQIYRDLQAKEDPLLTQDWMCDNSTIYADDIHLKETMTSVQGLDRMVHRFCTILDELRANGMVINLAKSAILLRHRGSFIKGWLRRHLITTKDGNVLRLRSPEGHLYEIPIREQHTYLGIKISYHAPSRCAVTSRLQAANQAWQRLRGVLCSTRHLALSERLQLWRTTVLPTLLYGIAATGPDEKDVLTRCNI
ncbi:unnamed protein product, partial [Symbiodinium sp. CCMP2592]